MAGLKNKSLFVVSKGQLFTALLLMAYARTHDDSDWYLYLDNSEEKALSIIEEVAEHLGVAILAESDLAQFRFDELYVHSWAQGEKLPRMLDALRYESIVLFADGFRPYILAEVVEKLGPKALLYFGYIPDDLSLSDLILEMRIEKRVVTSDSIRSIWELVKSIAGLTDLQFPKFQSTDLLIVDRYWGQSAFYQMWDTRGKIDVILSQIAHHNISKIYVKQDNRNIWTSGDVISDLREHLGGKYEVEPFPEFEEASSALEELHLLDFYFFNFDMGSFMLFAFDGTPNVVCGFTHPDAEILWFGSHAKDNELFVFPASDRLVMDTVSHQQQVLHQLKIHGNITNSGVLHGDLQQNIMLKLSRSTSRDVGSWDSQDMFRSFRYISRLLQIEGNNVFEILDRFNEDQVLFNRKRAETERLNDVVDDLMAQNQAMFQNINELSSLRGSFYNFMRSSKSFLKYHLMKSYSPQD